MNGKRHAAPRIWVVELRADAPDKPAPDAPCNGCGLCCAAVTCPAARLLFLRRRGPCPALCWDEGARCYRCGLLTHPERHFSRLPRGWQRFAAAWARRAIAAGAGCDCDSEVAAREEPTKEDE